MMGKLNFDTHYHIIVNMIIQHIPYLFRFLTLWSLCGERLMTWEAHHRSVNDKGDEQDAFIFGLAIDTKSGVIYSTGQDRCLRTWMAGVFCFIHIHP